MPQFTDTGVKSILENCFNIVSLNLSGCKNLTSDCLIKISNLKNLKELVLYI